MDNEKEDLRHLILNYEQPIIFKNLLKWNLLSWDINRWNEVFGDEVLKYRIGKRKFTKKPQWESTCERKQSTFKEFLQYVDENPDIFAYCDYKHLIENFENVKELQKGISWESLGFPDYTAEKSTIWIGSKGAHTPCHKDTYGCNLVAQIYGKKRWILFSPEENLFPTRVPYEESSIFSKLNLYSPDLNKIKGLSKCKSIILNPGDVLLVPHNWWHYVENLETAISINVWLERDDDAIKQLDESLVQFLIGRVFSDMNETQQDSIINPSVDLESFVEQTSLNTSLKIVNVCKERCMARKKSKQSNANDTKIFNFKEILEKYKENIDFIPDLTGREMVKVFYDQYQRFPVSNDSEGEDEDDILIKLINAFTNENVINLIKDYL